MKMVWNVMNAFKVNSNNHSRIVMHMSNLNSNSSTKSMNRKRVKAVK